jgi:hypothetical protein
VTSISHWAQQVSRCPVQGHVKIPVPDQEYPPPDQNQGPRGCGLLQRQAEQRSSPGATNSLKIRSATKMNKYKCPVWHRSHLLNHYDAFKAAGYSITFDASKINKPPTRARRIRANGALLWIPSPFYPPLPLLSQMLARTLINLKMAFFHLPSLAAMLILTHCPLLPPGMV